MKLYKPARSTFKSAQAKMPHTVKGVKSPKMKMTSMKLKTVKLPKSSAGKGLKV